MTGILNRILEINVINITCTERDKSFGAKFDSANNGSLYRAIKNDMIKIGCVSSIYLMI
jgi:hypothetical protein